jgi:hypothetical protein
MAAPSYSLLSGEEGHNKKSPPTKLKWPTKKKKNKGASAVTTTSSSSLLKRIRDHTFFLIEFYSGDDKLLLSQCSKKEKEGEGDADNTNSHRGWSERCTRLKVDDSITGCETIASPQSLLLGDAKSPPPSPPDMTFIASSSDHMNKEEFADVNDWIDFPPQTTASELDDETTTTTNNIIFWNDISSGFNNKCSNEGKMYFSFDTIDQDDEFWLLEQNTFQTGCHRKQHPKRKDDTDRISNQKIHAIAERLSPRGVAASSVDESSSWTSSPENNANSNHDCSNNSAQAVKDYAQIAFPFDDKSLLTSVTRNVSSLSKRCVSLQERTKKDDIDRRCRLEKISVLEGQIEKLLRGDDDRGSSDVDHDVTTYTNDSIVSTSTPPDDHCCSYDSFSVEDRETVFSLERLLTVKLAENKALAARADNLTNLLCKENSSVCYAKLPSDVTELDSLLAMNTTYEPHNSWMVAGQQILYCMRCDCNKERVCFVGQISEGKLWHTVGDHFNDLWRQVQGRRRSKKQDSIVYLSNDFGQSSFADHVVRKHLRNAPSRQAVRSWSGEMIRISIVEAHTKHAKVLLHDLLGSSASSASIELS